MVMLQGVDGDVDLWALVTEVAVQWIRPWRADLEDAYCLNGD